MIAIDGKQITFKRTINIYQLGKHLAVQHSYWVLQINWQSYRVEKQRSNQVFNVFTWKLSYGWSAH